ncbi:MAG: type II toxin-antitoxin system HigB family toxin [Balneolaceae bacterium]|nr:type II toxin-antitoxin system HigB family toxin [Balneolaceae bacterium]
MRIHLIKEKTVIDYANEHATSTGAFLRWIEIIKNADIKKPQDFVDLFGSKSVDILGNKSDRVCFNVGGNKHRIICSYYFNETVNTVTIFVKWIGTHAEYDAINEREEQYTIDKY